MIGDDFDRGPTRDPDMDLRRRPAEAEAERDRWARRVVELERRIRGMIALGEGAEVGPAEGGEG